MLSSQEMLFDLAGAAKLEQKRAAMAAGEHINTTEDRAVMHIALRAPRTKKLIVDGADVVPDVHLVLSKVIRYILNTRESDNSGGIIPPHFLRSLRVIKSYSETKF